MVDRAKLLAELAKAKERSGKVRFLKKGTTHHLRILEFEDEDGVKIFSRKFVEHFPAGGGSTTRGILCRSETFGKPCACCRQNELVGEAGEAAPWRYRTRYLINAVDLDNVSDKGGMKVGIWALPSTVWQDLVAVVVDDDWEGVLERKGGHGFTISREGSGLDTTYGIKPMRKSSNVPVSVAKTVSEPLEAIDDIALEAQCAAVNADMEELFEDSDVDLEELENEEEETPKKKKRKSSKKKKKAPVEEEEEEDDEEEDEEEEDDDDEGDDEDGDDDGNEDEDDDEDEDEAEEDDDEDGDEDEDEEKFICLGDPDIYEPGAECDTCSALKRCKKILKEKAAEEEETPKKKKKSSKKKKKAPVDDDDDEDEAPKKKKGKRRPKGSGNKKKKTKNKKSANDLAEGILGKKKKKKKKGKKF